VYSWGTYLTSSYLPLAVGTLYSASGTGTGLLCASARRWPVRGVPGGAALASAGPRWQGGAALVQAGGAEQGEVWEEVQPGRR
jgi:hypothetical protein